MFKIDPMSARCHIYSAIYNLALIDVLRLINFRQVLIQNIANSWRINCQGIKMQSRKL